MAFWVEDLREQLFPLALQTHIHKMSPDSQGPGLLTSPIMKTSSLSLLNYLQGPKTEQLRKEHGLDFLCALT